MIDIELEMLAAANTIGFMRGVVRSELIGSASYMPEKANDVDFAVLLDHDCMAYAAELMTIPNGQWIACGDYDSDKGLWCAIRRGYLNLMLTHDVGFYERYLTATEVCKALRLEHKEDRIAVCQIVRDGRKWNQTVTKAMELQHARAAAAGGWPFGPQLVKCVHCGNERALLP